jgi:hypothetical protein
MLKSCHDCDGVMVVELCFHKPNKTKMRVGTLRTIGRLRTSFSTSLVFAEHSNSNSVSVIENNIIVAATTDIVAPKVVCKLKIGEMVTTKVKYRIPDVGVVVDIENNSTTGLIQENELPYFVQSMGRKVRAGDILECFVGKVCQLSPSPTHVSASTFIRYSQINAF